MGILVLLYGVAFGGGTPAYYSGLLMMWGTVLVDQGATREVAARIDRFFK